MDRINVGFMFFACLVLLFVVLTITANVILRYFFNSPIMWVVVINENNLLYITFLTAAWLLQREGHVSLELVVNRLSQHRKTLLQVVCCAVGLAICLVITWFGARVTWTDFMSGALQPTITKVPNASVLFIIPAGSFLLAIEFLRKGYTRYREWKMYPKPLEGHS